MLNHISSSFLGIPEDAFDDTPHAVRQANAMITLYSMRMNAAKTCFKTDEEIDSLIEEASPSKM